MSFQGPLPRAGSSKRQDGGFLAPQEGVQVVPRQRHTHQPNQAVELMGASGLQNRSRGRFDSSRPCEGRSQRPHRSLTTEEKASRRRAPPRRHQPPEAHGRKRAVNAWPRGDEVRFFAGGLVCWVASSSVGRASESHPEARGSSPRRSTARVTHKRWCTGLLLRTRSGSIPETRTHNKAM